MKDLKNLIPYIKHYKVRILIGFLFVSLSNICSTYVPRVVGSAIDMLTSGDFSDREVLSKIGLLILLTAGSGFFMFLTRRTIIVASRLIEYDLRKDLFGSLETRSMSFFNRHSTGMLMAHATNDIPAAREFLGPAIMYSANTITVFAFTLYFMLTLNWQITLLALIPLPLIALTTYFIGRRVHKAFKKVQEQFETLTARAQEMFSGIRVVRSYRRETYEGSKFSLLSEDYMHKNMKLARYQSLMMPILTLMVGMSILIVLGYGGSQVINGKASLGDLTQFFIYIGLLIWPVAAIGWITNILQRASASSGRLASLMEKQPEQREIDKPIQDKKIQGDIILNNITYKYAKELNPALNNISIKIPKGQMFGLVGSIGSGKSTLINLITRLYQPTDGKILIDGAELNDYSIRLLRRSIGVVPQEPFLFSTSIRENIKFGNPEASDEDMVRASKIARLHEEIADFPNGYDTVVGERGITLSGGQKQRLAIARAIIKYPPILILDDALSAVDAETETDILNGLKKVMAERTVIVISHRISTVKPANNIINLFDGQIIEQGSHEELIKQNGLYAQMHEQQKLKEEIEHFQ